MFDAEELEGLCQDRLCRPLSPVPIIQSGHLHLPTLRAQFDYLPAPGYALMTI